MHTQQELAKRAAFTVLMTDGLAKVAGLTAEQRIDSATQIIADILQLAQDELLESQRETGVALAAALNLAGGK